MFTKLKSLKAYSDTTLTLQDLVDIIRDNPNKLLIERMRHIGKSSEDYNKLKATLPAIMPHGIFGYLKEESLIEISDYLFFDIDNLNDEKEARDTIKTLRDTFPIAMACISPGGRGIHFLIRIERAMPKNIPLDTKAIWKACYTRVKKDLLDSGFDIDEAAGGLARKMAISYDPEVIIDENAIWTIQIVKEDVEMQTPSVSDKRGWFIEQVIPTTREPIAWEDLLNRLVLATPAPKMDDPYLIEDQEYCDVKIFKIKDGMKRKTFILMMHHLMHLNPYISLDEAISFFLYVNNIQDSKMEIWNLRKLIGWQYKDIKTKGANPTLRIKKIHFREDMTTKEKQSISGKLTSLVRRNETVTKIYLAIETGYTRQKDVVAHTGLSIATVKRNWKAAQNCDIETAQDVIERPALRVRKQEDTKRQDKGEELTETATIEEEEFWEAYTKE